MPSVTKIWTFTSDLEGFADAGNNANVNFSHQSSDGSPTPGSLELAWAVASGQEFCRSAPGQTWESWGVPAGATVTHVRVVSFNYRQLIIFPNTVDVDFRIKSGSNNVCSSDLFTQVFTYTLSGWLSASGSQIAVDSAYQASNTSVRFEIDADAVWASSTSQLRFDSIQLEITYTGGGSGGGSGGFGTMAQTGLTTAVGLCLESSWRTSPISLQSGANYLIGVTGTNPHRFFIVEPGGGFSATPDIVVPDGEIDGDIELRRTIMQGKTYEGGYAFKADPENLYYPLLGMLGKDYETTLNASGSSAAPLVAKHQMTTGMYAPSFTLEEIFGDANYGRASSGVVLTSLELDFGKILTARLNGYGHRQVPNEYKNSAGVNTDYTFTSTYTPIPNQMGGDGTKLWKCTPSPTYVDVSAPDCGNGPLVFAAMEFGTIGGQFTGAFLTLNGVAFPNAEILEGFQLRFNRNVDSRMVGGSGFDPGSCTGNQLTITGRLSVMFKDTAFLLNALKHCKAGLNMKFRGPRIGLSSFYYMLEVFLPDIRLLNVPIEIPDGPIIISTDFVARKVDSLGYSCLITLTNTTSNALFGGEAGTTGAAGGLGGFTRSTVAPTLPV